MLLADPNCFSREHYEAHAGFAPAYLCELVVHCLELVSHLSRAGLSYRFKGGNSQLILLRQPERFSIDVDVVTTVSKEHFSDLVGSVVEAHPRFVRHEVRPHRTKPWLPILSFKLFFDSVFPSEEESFVILDAVFEPPAYGGEMRQVACGALYASDEQVEVPTVSGLLADKMLCISPATVGIPLGKNKEGHRLKHVFDVANLSRHEPELNVTAHALAACLEQENEIQKSAFRFSEVAEDTKAFCQLVVDHETPPPLESLEKGTYLDEIVRGFPEVESFLFRRHYDWSAFRDDCRQVIATFDALGSHF